MSIYNIHGSSVNFSDFDKLISKQASTISNSEHEFSNLAKKMGPADEGNPDIPAGFTYFGQFVDHDITFTKEGGINARTPLLDLDSLYGKGPDDADDSNLYIKNASSTLGRSLFKIGNKPNPDGDLQRDSNNKAIIPDPRNDENIIIASLQLLFQKFHNILVTKENLPFETAKTVVTWHYQSVVLNDFLPKIVGEELVDEILINGRKIYHPEKARLLRRSAGFISISFVRSLRRINDIKTFIPTEFAGACYRFGHSMVRNKYNFNSTFSDDSSHPNLFFGFPGGRPNGGHQITPIWTITGHNNSNKLESLKRFFDTTGFGGADNNSGKIDTKLPEVLFNLEVQNSESNNLAFRNLVSGQRLKLANGQQAVEFLKSKGITISELSESEIGRGQTPDVFKKNTPLWFYVLRESEIQENGVKLGTVGGRIVAETLIGLLQVDDNSHIHPSNFDTPWPFVIDGVVNRKVSMLDIIKFVDENHKNEFLGVE